MVIWKSEPLISVPNVILRSSIPRRPGIGTMFCTMAACNMRIGFFSLIRLKAMRPVGENPILNSSFFGISILKYCLNVLGKRSSRLPVPFRIVRISPGILPAPSMRVRSLSTSKFPLLSIISTSLSGRLFGISLAAFLKPTPSTIFLIG